MDKFSQLYDQYTLYKEKVNKDDSDFTTDLLQYGITEDYFNKVSRAVELLLKFYEVKLSNTTIRNAVAYRLNHNYTENVKLFTATTANDIYHQFKRKKINPVAKFRGPFIISPNLSLDVMVYSKTTPALSPSLKRFSKVAEYSDEPGTCEVQNERIYYVNDDPDKI